MHVTKAPYQPPPRPVPYLTLDTLHANDPNMCATVAPATLVVNRSTHISTWICVLISARITKAISFSCCTPSGTWKEQSTLTSGSRQTHSHNCIAKWSVHGEL
ncbi:unnamed protein product, partial [Ceratitis capitata]